MEFKLKTDSRRVKPGDTFIALRCAESDGHDYIENAIAAGATKIVAEKGEYSVETIIVPDTRKYLEEYLKENYDDVLNKMKFMVVTGTNGKTTMSYLLYQALNLLGKKCAYLGTLGFYTQEGKQYKLYNTTPDICDVYGAIVQAYNEGYEYFSLEASSHGIAQGRLNNLTYDYSVFTNLTHDHLDFHKTMENYALTKRQVFERLRENGKAIINCDDKYCDYFYMDNKENITYGTTSDQYKILNYEFTKDGTNFNVEINNVVYPFHMKLIGDYNVYNMLPVMIILKDMGYTISQIQDVISKLENARGRMETIHYGSNVIIVDYAHTPDGFEKLLGIVKQFVKGNIYIVFGVRGNRDRVKRPEMTRIATDAAKMTIITTNHVFKEDLNQIISDLATGADPKKCKVIVDRGEAIKAGMDLLEENDALLILGKGHEDYLDLGDKIIHFDDVEEVNKIIKETINS